VRQRRGSLLGLCCASAAADRRRCWGRFGVEACVRAQAATCTRSVRFTRRHVQPQALRPEASRWAPRSRVASTSGGVARPGRAPMLDSLRASPYVPASRWHSSRWSA